ncbi:M-phase inducer phosphatase 1-B-like [Heptranchias perlo]|uniref:M-phase inducer phosphatase 1-B-like n=1 Tax=Heptranchias perlo TaxID=212740 RepID=UPI00355A1AC6
MIDECEDISMALSPDSCPSFRLGCKKLLSIIQGTNSSMSFSPEPMTSPVPNRALNMSNLSSCDGETPKRCLDMSNLSNGGETSASPEILCRGLCLDSPGQTDVQSGESMHPIGGTQPLLPKILCSSPMFKVSGCQNLVQDHMDFRSLGHNKENEGDWFKRPVCPAPKIALLPLQDPEVCGTTSSSISPMFDFEMEGVSRPTSTEPLCLDDPMNEDSTFDVFSGLMQNDTEGNMNMTMSSSMAALLTSDLMNQRMDISTVPVRRSRPGLFRSPSMPEKLHRPFLKRMERSREMDTPVKTKRQRSFRNPLQESRFMRRAMTSCNIDVTNVLDEERNPMELIGNFSKVYALPTVLGKHEDLKYITPETMAKVLHGEYDHLLEGAYIVDCRYPYEFEGGHIKGALNLHKADDAVNHFLKKPIVPKSKDKRLIIIFHCEFSSERGPKMCRLLREEDRSMNVYPNLYYPELYILKGGYKAFFPPFLNHCDPPEYCPMDHEDFQEEMLKLRKKSKSWAGERRRRDLISRLGKM